MNTNTPTPQREPAPINTDAQTDNQQTREPEHYNYPPIADDIDNGDIFI